MSISTRAGDSGETDLLFGRRVPKTHPRMRANGAVDELSAAIGLARAQMPGHPDNPVLESIQRELVNLMGELAVDPLDAERYEGCSLPKLETAAVDKLDALVAQIEAAGLTFKGWAMPGANPASAGLDFARTICRRAEREVVALIEEQPGRHALAVRFLNRLSDALWLLARKCEAEV